MSMTQKRRLGALFSIVVLCVLTLAPVSAYASSVTDSQSRRFAAPGYPGGIDNNLDQRWGPTFGALGGINISGAGYSTFAVKECYLVGNGRGICYVLSHDTLNVGDVVTIIVPIHIFNNVTSYTWQGTDNSAVAYTFGDDLMPDGIRLMYFPAGQAYNSDDQDGNYATSFPSGRVNYYAKFVVTVTSSNASGDWRISFAATSPLDDIGDENFDDLLHSVNGVLDDPGVAAVGEKILDVSDYTWVATLISINALLIIAALLINFLLSL